MDPGPNFLLCLLLNLLKRELKAQRPLRQEGIPPDAQIVEHSSYGAKVNSLSLLAPDS